MAKVAVVEGIGEAYAKRLEQVGIRTVEALLKRGATPKGRKEIAEATGINEALILQWVNQADLFRIKGVGEEYADLLEASGVDSVPELAQRKAENLYARLVEVNREKKLVRRLPIQKQVAAWIEQARQLPRVVTY